MAAQEFYDCVLEAFELGRYEDVAAFGYSALVELPIDAVQMRLDVLYRVLQTAHNHWRGAPIFSEYQLNFGDLLAEALDLVESAADPSQHAQFLRLGSWQALFTQNLTHALDLMQQAVSHAEKTDNIALQCLLRAELGQHTARRNLAEGLTLVKDAYLGFEEYLTQQGEGYVSSRPTAEIRYRLQFSLGSVELDSGNYTSAHYLLQTSYKGFMQLGLNTLAPSVQHTLASLYLETGQLEEAESLLQSTIGALESVSAYPDIWQAANLALLGKVYIDTDVLVKAKPLCQLSLKSPALVNNHDLATVMQNIDAEFWLASGDYAASERVLQANLALCQEAELYGSLVVAQSLLGRVALAQRHIDRAYQFSQQAIDTLTKLGGDLPTIRLQEVYYYHAIILQEGGQHNEALGYLKRANSVIMQRAEAISDEAMQQAYLYGLPINREIIEQSSQR